MLVVLVVVVLVLGSMVVVLSTATTGRPSEAGNKDSAKTNPHEDGEACGHGEGGHAATRATPGTTSCTHLRRRQGQIRQGDVDLRPGNIRNSARTGDFDAHGTSSGNKVDEGKRTADNCPGGVIVDCNPFRAL